MNEHLIWVVQGVFFTLFMEFVALILAAWRASQEKRRKQKEFKEKLEDVLKNNIGGIQK